MNRNPIIIKVLFCIIFILAGVFTILTSYAPSNAGMIGQYYYRFILIPVFGHATKLFGLYLIAAGGFSALSHKPVQKIVALTLFVLPITIWLDKYYITENFPAKSFFVQFVESNIVLYIGNIGLKLIELISFGTGAFLLIPAPIWDRILSKETDSRMEKRVDESDLIEEEKTEDEELLIIESPVSKRKKRAAAPSESPLKEKDTEEDNVTTKTGIKKRTSKSNDILSKSGKISLNLKPIKKNYQKPKLTELKKQPADSVSYGEKKDKIIDVFSSLGVEIDIGTITGGPSVEQYEIIPGKGVKLSQIKKLDEDLSLALKSKVLITFNSHGSLCLEAPINKRRTVFFRRLLETADDINNKLPVVLGVNASYETFSFDLAELPHLLIAGTTGSGKSILVKSILASIMYNLTPNDVRLVLIDPKRVDFSIFNTSSFLACRVITDMADASNVLLTLVEEMEKRYDILERNNSSNILQYNDSVKAGKKLPYIITVVDEFADLIMGEKGDIGDNIIRIAQKARACGIHLILATQRPSAEVISGLIKANVPGKIALSVSSSINSKIIIDRTGAEKLLGKGDMIFISPEVKDGVRLQGAFISDQELMKFMN